MLLNRLFVGLAAQALFQRVAGTSNAPIARAPLTTSALVKLAKNTNQPAVKAKATPKSARKSSTATTKKSKADVTADATAKAEKAKKLAEKRESAKQDKLQRELANKEKKQKEKEKALAQKQKEKARELARKEKEKAKELAKKEKKQKDKARELARKEKEKAKELAKKEKASKAKTPKDKPWELRDADGKLVPLPMATKPKRKTSFLLYFADRFVQLKHLDEYQKISPSSGKRIPDLVAMTTSVAKEWKELPDAQRAEFEKKVAESKVQYEKDLQAWRESLTQEDIRRQNLYYSHQRKAGKVTPSNLRDPNMPKRPPGAFFLFVQEQRNAGSLSGSVLEQSRQAGEMWKSMSADKRQAYEKLGAQQLEEYSQAMEKYKASNQIA